MYSLEENQEKSLQSFSLFCGSDEENPVIKD
jgi:hypothetical protein